MTDGLAVEARDVSHFYGERAALLHVSMSVRQGEMFGIVGSNGSGKSTLFRILTTLILPSEGTASVLGASIHDQPKLVRSSIGVVFQESILDGKLTLRENLLHHGHLYGMWGKSLRARVDKLLAMTKLTDRRDDRVETLSGGLRRRGELAGCLMHEPPVLLLDEPTVGLDPIARREFWDDVAEMRVDRGLTVLLTTHLMDEADRCTRLALLREGEVLALASPDELKRDMGYDIVTIRTARPDWMASGLFARFELKAYVEEGGVRVETVGGHRWIGQFIDEFGDDVDSITVAKPSIDDVLLHRKRGLAISEDENASDPSSPGISV